MKITKITALVMATLMLLCCAVGCDANTNNADLNGEPLVSQSATPKTEETDKPTTEKVSSTTETTTTKSTTASTTTTTATTATTTTTTSKKVTTTTVTTITTTTTAKSTTTTKKPTTTKITEAVVDDDSSEMVWIPQSGKKYHRYSGCSNMKNPREVTLEEAKSEGYTACKRCYK